MLIFQITTARMGKLKMCMRVCVCMRVCEVVCAYVWSKNVSRVEMNFSGRCVATGKVCV